MTDPAFLMYSKDWLEGTAELSPAEKGIFIDLLCHQHQRGSIPDDVERLARMARLSIEEFKTCWEVLSVKFERTLERSLERTLKRLVNRRLERTMSERSSKAKKNKIIGTFGSIVKAHKLTKKQYNIIRSRFNPDDFEGISSERLSERLSECFSEWLACIEDANANEDANEDINENAFSNWKKNFEVYEKIVTDAHAELLGDSEELKKQEELNPGCDVVKSLEKAVHNFWGKKAGWEYSKKHRTGIKLDMRSTLINAISINKVYIQKPKNNNRAYGRQEIDNSAIERMRRANLK